LPTATFVELIENSDVTDRMEEVRALVTSTSWPVWQCGSVHFAAHGCAVEARSSLQQALFWMNLYLAMLAVQQRALHKMRRLVAGHPVRSEQYAPDLQLVETEIEKVLTRLEHWPEVVDMANRAAATT
jgi:hypothetical protein